MAFFMGKTEITFEKNYNWIDVVSSSPDDAHLFRQKFRARVKLNTSEFPLKGSTILFPDHSHVVCSLFYPWDDSLGLIDQVRQVIEGKPPQKAVLPATLQMMSVPFDPTVSLVDQVAKLSLFNKPATDCEEVVALQYINTVLRIEELAIYHFLSKKLSREAQIMVGRELKGNKILSEVQRCESATIKTAPMGITRKTDRKRKDRYYAHGYTAFPSETNARRLEHISPDLSKKSMIQMAFVDRPDTVVLPYDIGCLRSYKFEFLKKIYTVRPDSTSVSYLEEGKLVFRHTCKDATFYGNSRDAIQGLFKVMARFVVHLDEQAKREITKCPDGSLLKELFNDLFGFRVQVSFPGELPCTPYSHPNYPLTRLEELANMSYVSLPNLEQCRALYQKVYDALPVEKPEIGGEIALVLCRIYSFLNAKFNDGTNSFKDAFSFYGAISAQISLHFMPEITPTVLKTIMQLDKWCKTTKSPPPNMLLLIKEINGHEITFTSLIEKSLLDRDPIEMRMPPNSRFDTEALQAEANYLAQLSVLYEHGSHLIASLATLARKPLPFTLFSQDKHVQDTCALGLERLAYPLHADLHTFKNVHGYSQEQFQGEFIRGMTSYLTSFEVVEDDQIKAHIVDWVKRFVDGASLLEPRFKHDLLDLKHFAAGMTSPVVCTFVDGTATFSELVMRALYEIQRQKKRTVNGQLIVDAVHMFLKTQSQSTAERKELTEYDTYILDTIFLQSKRMIALEAIKKINISGYEERALDGLMLEFNRYSPDTFPYIIHCMNIFRLQLQKDHVQKDDLAAPLRAIWEKINDVYPDQLSEGYFTIFPSVA